MAAGTHFWRDAAAGAGYLHAGVRDFYRDPSLWSYAFLPMGIVLAFYALVMILLVGWGIPALAGLLPDPAAWSVYWRWLIHAARALVWLSMFIMAMLAGISMLGTLYEALGAIFFDGMVARYEKTRYGIVHAPLPLRRNLGFLAQSVRFSLVTMLLWLLLLIPGFLIPVVGILPAVLIVGYRFGLTYVFSSAFADGRGIGEIRRMASGSRALMLGFGAAAYLWLLIPFSAVFLLPGFALGGAKIYRERLASGGAPFIRQGGVQ